MVTTADMAGRRAGVELVYRRPRFSICCASSLEKLAPRAGSTRSRKAPFSCRALA